MDEKELVYDSDEDPDYVPNDNKSNLKTKTNLITKEVINEVILNIEIPPIPPTGSWKRQKYFSSKTDNISSSKKTNNGG